MAEILLHIGGVTVQGWTSVRIHRSIESVAHTISLGYHTDAGANQLTRFPYELGAPIRITSDGQDVVDGFIDDADIDIDEKNHQVEIVGRSRGGQLVDSSAYYETGTWRNKKCDAIIRNLLEGYEVDLVVPPDVAFSGLGEPFKKFAINYGESVFDACDRAARERGLMLIADTGASVTLKKAAIGPPQGSLGAMADIVSHSRRGRFTDRFQYYLIRGKHPGNGDIFTGDLPANVYRAVDEGVGLHRIKIISGNGGPEELRKTVEWERNVRAGRSRRFFVGVRGWHRADGRLWTPDEMTMYIEPQVYANGELLIVSCDYQLTPARGDICMLELGNREAFDLVEPPSPRLGRKKKKPGLKDLPKGWVKGLFLSAASQAAVPATEQVYTKLHQATLGPESKW